MANGHGRDIKHYDRMYDDMVRAVIAGKAEDCLDYYQNFPLQFWWYFRCRIHDWWDYYFREEI